MKLSREYIDDVIKMCKTSIKEGKSEVSIDPKELFELCKNINSARFANNQLNRKYSILKEQMRGLKKEMGEDAEG